MNIFFCDITGTYNGSNDDRENQISRLVNNLTTLCNTLEAEELIFDFVSTERMSYLLEFVNEFASYLKGTPIRLGHQFSEEEVYIDGHVEHISENNKLNQIYRVCNGQDVERVIFADDTILNQMILQRSFSSLRPEVDFVSLIPNNSKERPGAFISKTYGIEGLNEALEKYIISLSEKRGL